MPSLGDVVTLTHFSPSHEVVSPSELIGHHVVYVVSAPLTTVVTVDSIEDGVVELSAVVVPISSVEATDETTLELETIRESEEVVLIGRLSLDVTAQLASVQLDVSEFVFEFSKEVEFSEMLLDSADDPRVEDE